MSASHSLFPGCGHTRTTPKALANLAPHDVIPYFTSSSSHSSRGESFLKFHLDGIIRGIYFKKTSDTLPTMFPFDQKGNSDTQRRALEGQTPPEPGHIPLLVLHHSRSERTVTLRVSLCNYVQILVASMHASVLFILV